MYVVDDECIDDEYRMMWDNNQPSEGLSSTTGEGPLENVSTQGADNNPRVGQRKERSRRRKGVRCLVSGTAALSAVLCDNGGGACVGEGPRMH
jgi:hypothetical protein